MHTYPNARLTAVSRERLVRRHIQDAEPLADLAAQAGISLRTAYKWLARYRSGGRAALVDRRSERRTQRRTLDPHQLQQAVDLRDQCCTLRRIARLLAAPLSTVGEPSRPWAWDVSKICSCLCRYADTSRTNPAT